MTKHPKIKLILYVLVCLLILMAAALATGENYKSYNPYVPYAELYDISYDEIIEIYLAEFEAHRKDEHPKDHDLYNDNIDWEYSAYFEGQKNRLNKTYDYIKNHIGYAITDINEDGINELVICAENAYIYEVYTMENGKVRDLIRAGARNRCHLLKDKTLFRHSSSGADYFGYYAFRMDGTNPLIFIKGYHFNGDMAERNVYNIRDCWFKADSDKGLYDVTTDMHVSSDEVDRWIEECEANYADIRFIPFAAYEQGVKGEAIGVLSYKGEITDNQKINIRKKPAKDGRLVTTKRVGTYVSVLAQSGDYFQIVFGKTKGYVHKDYITLLTVSEDEIPTEK